ncbi:phosphatase PAP2 family protein [Nocardia paucivorans]|uniref:phosphatase PAP2 family protein n=1 Tax=Nocardia paucivorans TaxID=114259 RepID=UPI000313A06A|nr:phosphatase PAP2 family protein [Nocardia paucivorans]
MTTDPGSCCSAGSGTDPGSGLRAEPATGFGPLRARRHLGTVAAGAAVTVGVARTLPPDGAATPFDEAMSEPVDTALDPHPWLAEVFALPTNTWVVLALLCAGAAWFAWQRRWWETAVMMLAPQVAVAVNAWVLKPVWSRPLHDYLAYPSGHTVHLISVATIFVLLIESLRARIVLVSLTVCALLVGGIGMIALDYHHPTDILGGAGAAVALSALFHWAATTVGWAYARRAPLA